MSIRKFYLGTTNPYKIREIGKILQATGCEFEACGVVDPDETEDDFVGNALLKARAYAEYTGGLTISEDSGLVVPAINNLPGPWSARFSDCEFGENHRLLKHVESKRGRDEIDHANNELVLEMMKDIKDPHRVAKFVVVLVVAAPGGGILFQSSTGESHGRIAAEMRGSNGFGYDPIFVGNDTFDLTYAQLDSHRKNLRSHRREVLKEFRVWLSEYVKENV